MRNVAYAGALFGLGLGLVLGILASKRLGAVEVTGTVVEAVRVPRTDGYNLTVRYELGEQTVRGIYPYRFRIPPGNTIQGWVHPERPTEVMSGSHHRLSGGALFGAMVFLLSVVYLLGNRPSGDEPSEDAADGPKTF